MADRNLQININVGGNAAQAMNSLIGQLRQLGGASQQAAQGANAQANAAKAQAQAANQQAAANANAAKAIKQTGTAAETAQQTIDRLRRTGYALQIGGLELVVVGHKLTSAFTDAAKTFMEFDFNMRRAAGALDLFQSSNPQVFGDLSRQIQDLSIATKAFSPAEIAKDTYFWASTTGEVAKTSEQLANVLNSKLLPVMKAAAMTEVGQEQAIKGVVSVMQQYGLSSDRTADVTEKMFYAAQKTSMEFNDLTESFKMVGPIAAQYNVTFEDSVRVFGALANAGIRGTMAGRSFRQMFAQTIETTIPATKALNALVESLDDTQKSLLGITPQTKEWNKAIFDSNGNFRGFEHMISTIAVGMRNMTEQQRSHLLQVITTAAELPSMVKLLNEQNDAMKEGTSLFADSEMFKLSDAARVFAENWKQIGDSARYTFQQMRNQVAPLVLLIGESLTRQLRPVAAAIGDIATKLVEWGRANPVIFDAAVKMGALAAVMATAGGTFLILNGAMLLMRSNIMILQKEFFKKTAVVAGNTLALNANTTATTANAHAQMLAFHNLQKSTAAASGSRLSNLLGSFGISGITRVIGSIVGSLGRLSIIATVFTVGAGAVAGFIQKVDLLNNTSFRKLIDSFGKIFDAIVGLGGKLFALGEAFGSVAASFVNSFGPVLDAISGVIDKAAEAVSWLEKVAGAQVGGQKPSGYGQEPSKNFFNPDFGQQVAMNLGLGALAGYNAEEIEKKKSIYWELLQKYNKDKAEFVAALEDGIVARAIGNAIQSWVDQFKLPAGWVAALSASSTEGLASVFDNTQEFISQKADEMSQTVVRPIAETMKRLVEEIRTGVGKEFGSGNKGSFLDEAGKNLIGGLIKAIDSGTPAMKKSASDSMLAYMNVLKSDTKMKIPTIGRGIIDAVNNGVKDGTPSTRKAFLDYAVTMATALKNGGSNAVIPAAAAIMNDVGNKWKEGTPKAHAAAREWMTFLAQGIQSNAEPGDATYNMMAQIIGFMGSGAAGAFDAGYALMDNFIKSQVAQMPRLQSLMAAINAYKAALGAITSLPSLASAGQLEQGHFAVASASVAQAQANYDAAMKAAMTGSITSGGYTPKLPGTGSGSGGGGGGGGGSKKSPLEEALEVAQKAAELAEALQKIGGRDIKSMVKESMDKVAAAMLLAQQITAKYSKQISTKTLQQTAEFADAAGKIASMISSAVDAFDKARNYKRVPADVFKKIDIDIMLAVKEMVKIAGTVKIDALASATVFAEGAQNVVEVYGAASEAFEKLPKTYKVHPSKIFAAISKDIETAVRQMAAVSKNVKRTWLSDAQTFAEGSKDVVDAIGSAVEAFKEIPDKYTSQPSATLKVIAEDIARAVIEMNKASKRVNSEVLKSAKDFASGVGDTVSVIGDAIGVFKEIPKDGIKRNAVDVFANIAADMVLAVTELGKAAKTADKDLFKAAEEFSEAGGSSVKAIAEAFAGFKDLKQYSGVAPEAIQRLVDDIELSLTKMSEKAKAWTGRGEELDQIKSFADAAESVASAIGSVYDAFRPRKEETLGENERFVPIDFEQTFGQIEMTLDKFKDMSSKFGPDTVQQIKDFAEMASGVGEAIGSFFSLLDTAKNKVSGGGDEQQASFTLAGQIQEQLNLILNSVTTFNAHMGTKGGDLITSIAAGMKAQEAALITEVERINSILGSVGGTATVSFSVTVAPATVNLNHNVTSTDGSLDALKEEKIASMLNAKESTDAGKLAVNLTQASATR